MRQPKMISTGAVIGYSLPCIQGVASVNHMGQRRQEKCEKKQNRNNHGGRTCVPTFRYAG